jgi:hypothetical protein
VSVFHFGPGGVAAISSPAPLDAGARFRKEQGITSKSWSQSEGHVPREPGIESASGGRHPRLRRRLKIDPEGVVAISRGLSAAPLRASVSLIVGQSPKLRRVDPSRVGHRAGTPPGCGHRCVVIRGCRFARPPANGWHPIRGACVLADSDDRHRRSGSHEMRCRIYLRLSVERSLRRIPVRLTLFARPCCH